MGPMVFQERIAPITEGLNWNYVLAYIDDIIVVTKGDYENHLEVMQQVLERLRKYRLRVIREKCSFACKEVRYLGYEVSTVGISPQYEYLDRICAWPKSRCTSSVLRPLQILLGNKRSMSDGFPNMMSVLKNHNYFSMDKS